MKHRFITTASLVIVLGMFLIPQKTAAQPAGGASGAASGAAACAFGGAIGAAITSAISGALGGGAVSGGAATGGGAATALVAVPVLAPNTDAQLVISNTQLGLANGHLTANSTKNFTLDRLASCAAKQLLHQMTADTIAWINSGFRGGPAFLQNPRGFLLDTADQFTGMMIGNNGLLKGLCSPWNIDIRLKLALETTGGEFDSRRYTCTLNTIIGQARNASIDGFIGGDFKQGGWRAFMEMTAGSQNPSIQYLLAKSELQSSINKATKAINDELAQGMGFLSSEKCTNVAYDSIGTVNAGETFQYANIQANPDGTYKQCVKTTPGSVVANALNVHTNSGIVEAELANDINAVTSALFTQLTNQLLKKGLSELSGGGSGTTLAGRTSLNSSISQLQAAAYTPQTVTTGGGTYTVQNGTITQTGSTPTNTVPSMYTTAITTLGASKARYTQARACFNQVTMNGQLTSSLAEAETQRNTIDDFIRTAVDPLIASTTAAQTSVASLTTFTPADTSKAQSALTTAQTRASVWDQDAAGYLTACQIMTGFNP